MMMLFSTFNHLASLFWNVIGAFKLFKKTNI